jgi:hypothetical protein
MGSTLPSLLEADDTRLETQWVPAKGCGLLALAKFPQATEFTAQKHF